MERLLREVQNCAEVEQIHTLVDKIKSKRGVGLSCRGRCYGEFESLTEVKVAVAATELLL